MAEPKPKSSWGGKREGAGRKKRGDLPRAAASALKGARIEPLLEDVEKAAMQHALDAVEALAKQLVAGESESAQVRAANALLDRGYGKPTAQAGGDMMLPFLGRSTSSAIATAVREAAQLYGNLALATLRKISERGRSESARVKASTSLLDRGIGTVAPARIDEAPLFEAVGKKATLQQSAREIGSTGRFATPAPPRTTVQ